MDKSRDSPEKNKENVDVSSKKPVKSNRRDSLGKGILKNLPHYDENNTVHVMQLPLRDSQQNDKSHWGKKSYRRRVSFAPEVTLHKIDLIPSIATPEPSQPRRRTIAILPNSSQESITSVSPLPHFNVEEDDDDAEEIMYDSSDVEMEDATNVYSSPDHIKGPKFKIHEDQAEDQTEELTETVDMSISRVLDEDEDNTMDLTKPLGYIQSSHIPAQTLTEIPLTQQPLSPHRPFGSIKSLFSDEDEDDDLNEEEEEEVEMDLTQSFPKNQSFIQTDLSSQEMIPTQEVLSQKSSSPSKSQPETLIPTQVISQSSQEILDVTLDETMNLTSLAEGTTHKLTLQNTLHNRQIGGVESELTMEQTKMLGSIKQVAVNEDDSILSTNEVTMDETKLYFTNDNNESRKNSFGNSNIKATTPLKANRSHTSETGSPMSSKRKNVDNSSRINDLREKINSLTPKKRRKSSINKIPEVILEAELPVFPSQAAAQEDNRLSFTPLRTTKNANRTPVHSTRPEFGPLTEKAPLAPSHEQDENESHEYQPVTLKKFLNDLSIEFFDDLNINDDFIVEMKQLKDGSEISPVDYTIAKFSKIPWLELYSFSCNELQTNMNELKQLFDNLDLEFADENPQLVKDYYETKSIQQQKKMSDNLLLMKTYSDKEAEKAWYSWRGKLLDELLNRLEANVTVLQADSKIVSKELKKVAEKERVVSIEHSNLLEELDNVEKKQDLLHSTEMEDLIDLRKQYLNELESFIEAQERLESLETEVKELTSKMVDTSALEQEIKEKTSYIEGNSQEPVERLNNLLESFSREECVSGIQFNKLTGHVLTVTLISSKIMITISLDDISKRDVQLPSNLPIITKHFLQKYLNNNPKKELSELVADLQTLTMLLNSVDNSLYYLNLICPSKVDISDGIKVDILDFSKDEKYKAKIKLNIDNAMLFESKALSIILDIQLVYGPQTLNEEKLFNTLKSKFPTNNLIESVTKVNLIR